MKTQLAEHQSFGVTDWRGVFGSPEPAKTDRWETFAVRGPYCRIRDRKLFDGPGGPRA